MGTLQSGGGRRGWRRGGWPGRPPRQPKQPQETQTWEGQGQVWTLSTSPKPCTLHSKPNL